MKILMVGCGKMGGALLGRWIEGGDEFTVVDPGLDQAPDGVRLVRERESLGDERFDMLVVAIKPQMIDDVLPEYATTLADDAYVLSIAAGCSLARIERLTGAAAIRVMPNLPAAIGHGVSGLCPGTSASAAHRSHAEALMAHAGAVVAVADEDALDRVTAVAGSGPGYVFEIARAYLAAARDLGFNAEQARTLVLGTLLGTIEMAADSDLSLEELRNSVTSKNGTTQAGLEALNGDGLLSQRFRETVDAAYARAVELR